MEEIFKSFRKICNVFFILSSLLDVKRYFLELIEVLKPSKVVFTLDEAKHSELFDVAECQVVLV